MIRPVSPGQIYPQKLYAVGHNQGAGTHGAGGGAIWTAGRPVVVAYSRFEDGVLPGSVIHAYGLIPICQCWEVIDGYELNWVQGRGWRYEPAEDLMPTLEKLDEIETQIAEAPVEKKVVPLPEPFASDPALLALAKARARVGI